MKTVKEVAKIAGLSERALRHYDNIGLLVPKKRSSAGYRLYDDEDLKRLRAIVFLKEMEIPLSQIKEILDAGKRDYNSVLKAQKEKLVRKVNKLNGLIRVIDGLDSEGKNISFEPFTQDEAKTVSDILIKEAKEKEAEIKKVTRKPVKKEDIAEMKKTVETNLTQGEIGEDILRMYGSKENYLKALKEIDSMTPEGHKALEEELKDIYHSFAKLPKEQAKRHKLVQRLEDNTNKMYHMSNARSMLIAGARSYISDAKVAGVIDSLYGEGVAQNVGRAVLEYYGES